jgi:hypothetical protein
MVPKVRILISAISGGRESFKANFSIEFSERGVRKPTEFTQPLLTAMFALRRETEGLRDPISTPRRRRSSGSI